jgi:hypothetical protein
VSILLGPWGLLPFVVPLFAFIAARLGAVAFAGVPSHVSDRAVAGVILAFATSIAAVGFLAWARVLSPLTAVGALVIQGFALRRSPPFGIDFASARHLPRFERLGVLATLLVAAVGLAIAVTSARLLPVWQWDSLGYHLPFVHFTLDRSGAGVPDDLEYIGSYPHNAELFFVALRLCLADDRLIDLGQVPFGVGGAIVVAALARRGAAGASRSVALLAGAAWLVVPAVFLQLPTDYVDVATATFFLAAIYFVLAPASSRSIVLAGLALGLFVGTKPSAPLPGAVLFAVLATRAFQADARNRRAIVGAAVAIVVFGGGSYATNLVVHHNPIWPVAFEIGPLHVPGLHPLRELLAAGAAAPRLHGPLLWRMLLSFCALTSVPVFDMRVGGFGPVFLLALPFALARLVKVRSLALWVACASTLLSPDPAIARYVLAFVGVVLALAAPVLLSLTEARRTAVEHCVAALAALQLVYATPGLRGEGPSLWSYLSMTDAARSLAVSADGGALPIAEARRLVGPAETFAFDENMDLCDQAWDEAQRYSVVYLPATLAAESIPGVLAAHDVRVLAVGDSDPLGVWAASHPQQFERRAALRSCRKGTCSIFARR